MGSPDAPASMIQQVRRSLLVASAAGIYLDAVGNNRGVPRPDNTSDEELYRSVIKALAWLPKSILLSYYALLSAVFGSQAQAKLQVGRSWKLYEVNANEVILELPSELIFSAPEVSSYMHGVSGYASVLPPGPSNTFTTTGDVRVGSATTLVGAAIQVFFSGAWNDYTVSSVSYSSTTNLSTVIVSAATIPAGGGPFSIVIPGDGTSSSPGDYLAASEFISSFTTGAGPTDTISVLGDATTTLAVGHVVSLTVGATATSYSINSLSYSSATNRTTIVVSASTVPGNSAGLIFKAIESADVGTTTPPHDLRVYLAGQGLLDVAVYYINLLVRTSGVVLRVEIV